MVELTPRLSRRIQRDFLPGTAEQVVGYLAGLSAEAFGGQDAERVQAAMVLAAEGEWDRFTYLVHLIVAWGLSPLGLDVWCCWAAPG